ncbi:hypothetical protein DMA11_20970 [Marinilabiliaceae bacterium JC017]|nr:hypothetical protein DMA11_20970 [Marinilabiliaceae bacterium JC017]
MIDVQNPVNILVTIPEDCERGLFLIGDRVILKGFNLGLLSYAFEKVVTFGAGLLMKFKMFRNYWF